MFPNLQLPVPSPLRLKVSAFPCYPTLTPSGCPLLHQGVGLNVGDNVAGTSSVKTSGPRDCSDRCTSNIDCVAWTLNTETNLCWLKTSSNNQFLDKEMIWALRGCYGG